MALPVRSKRVWAAAALFVAGALTLELLAGLPMTDHPIAFLVATLASGILLGQWTRPRQGHFIR